jgi:uncharacterized membrane protein YfcA
MKITTQLVVMISIIVVGMVGMVLGLAVLAHWSDGAILGMAAGFGTIATGLIMAVRNQQQTTESLQAQDRKLDTVVAQTNGMSEREKQEIADRAAVGVIQAWKRGEI